MPTYRITGPDGRTLNVTGPTMPTEAEIDAIFAKTAPAAPAAPAAPQNPALPEHRTALETTFGVLNTVPRMLQQGVTSGIQVARGQETVGQALKDVGAELNPYSKTTGETPLKELGMGEGLLRTTLGLGLDLASPMGLPAKAGMALGLGAKAASHLANPVGAAAVGAGKVVAKGGQRAMAASPTLNKAVTAVVEPVEKLFVQYPGMRQFATKAGDQTAEDKFRLHEAKLRGVKSTTDTEIAQLFKAIPENERKLISDFINEPTAHPLPGNRPDLHQASIKLQDMMHNQFLDEVKHGVSNPNNFVQQYFPWIIKHDMNQRALDVANFKGTSQFSKKRNLPDWQAAKAHGAETDAAKAVAKRLEVGQRAVANVGFFDEMAKEFGQSLKHVNPQTGATTAVAMPAGFRKLNMARTQLPEASRVYLSDVAFPAKMADQLEKGHIMWADPDGFAKLIQQVTRGFKTVVTTFNPAHHMNNLQGNVNLMRLGGMAPKAIFQAYTQGVPEVRALTGQVSKSVSPQQHAQKLAALHRKPLTQNVTTGEAWEAATRFNLFGSSEAATEMARLNNNRSLLSTIADEARLQTSRVIEDPARWALFKDYVLKAKAPQTLHDKQKLFEQAAIHVKNHLFDYSELTDFERGLRDYGLIPFYSWLRKNTALQLSSLVKEPQKWRQLQVLYEAPERLSGGDDLLMPDYMKEEGYKSLGRNEQGEMETIRFANPALDLNKLTSPRAAIGGSLGPLPRMVGEGLFGRNIRTGQQILGTKSGYVPAPSIPAAIDTVATKTKLPLDKLVGTIPTLPDGKIMQPEVAAFVFSQIPVPLMPYAQQLLGSPQETLGTQLKTTWGQAVANSALRSLGLTPKDLTAEQQLTIMEQLIDQLTKTQEIETTVMKAVGQGMRKGAQK